MRNDTLNAEAGMNTRASEFFYDNRLVGERTAAPAIILGHVREQQADSTRLAPRLGVGTTMLIPSRLM